MQYLLMLYADFSAFQTFTPEQQEEGLAAYMAYAEALRNAGVLRGQNRLQPSTAATPFGATSCAKRSFSASS
jgi:hypothetical protein